LGTTDHRKLARSHDVRISTWSDSRDRIFETSSTTDGVAVAVRHMVGTVEHMRLSIPSFL